MTRQNWDRVAREDKYLAARRHQERLLEELTHPLAVTRRRSSSTADDQDYDRDVAGTWWSVPPQRWREFRIVLAEILRHDVQVWCVGELAHQHVMLVPEPPGYSVRVPERSGETAAGSDETTHSREWQEVTKGVVSQATGAAVRIFNEMQVSTPDALRLGVVGTGLTYGALVDAFATPSLGRRQRSLRARH